MEDRTRQAAVVRDVFYGTEDHGIFTCYIRLDFESGGTQSFGGLFLDKERKGPDFYRTVCSMFGVNELKEIVGKRCYGLYCFGYLNDQIEGIEVENGRRLTITGFARRYDKDVKTPLDREKERHYNDIKWAERRIYEAARKLGTLDKEYKSWE
jgi:hypothetical protein